jgi:hypothetical protein
MAASHWQTLSHNVVLLALSGSRTHNFSGDRHRLHQTKPLIACITYVHRHYWCFWRKMSGLMFSVSSDCKVLWQDIFVIMLFSLPWAGVEPTTSVVIGTDYIGSCKSNYHAIMATMSPKQLKVTIHVVYIYTHYIYKRWKCNTYMYVSPPPTFIRWDKITILHKIYK